MWMMNRLAMLGGALALLTGRSMQAEEVPASNGTESIKKQSEAAMIARTLGGRQFWGDVHYFHGWRIQQNVFTKHYRLINPENVRHASGSFEDCQYSLKKITEDEKLPAMSGSAVILIHGLLQSSRCMGDMGAALRDAGYTTIQFDYPSTQISIPEAARYLDRMVASLDGVEEINFVVHSMGGLVVRAYSAEYEDPRIKRMVMLGTPNLGAELADISQKYWLVRTAAGPGARQLGTRADGLISKLPVPKFEFAVIAGSRGTTTGWNPLIPGDDDGNRLFAMVLMLRY